MAVPPFVFSAALLFLAATACAHWGAKPTAGEGPTPAQTTPGGSGPQAAQVPPAAAMPSGAAPAEAAPPSEWEDEKPASASAPGGRWVFTDRYGWTWFPDGPATAADDSSVPEGRWVYTERHGWIWVPDAPPSADAAPYSYVYYPSYGWAWSVSPWWAAGWGPGPYYAGLYGPYYAGPYWPYAGFYGSFGVVWHGHGGHYGYAPYPPAARRVPRPLPVGAPRSVQPSAPGYRGGAAAPAAHVGRPRPR